MFPFVQNLAKMRCRACCPVSPDLYIIAWISVYGKRESMNEFERKKEPFNENSYEINRYEAK